jgi:primosomal protein N' (replication factor Y)
VGSLVEVPFHGRSVRGWVLGPAVDVPARTLRVKKVVSPVRFFDEDLLEVLRWVSERYVAPLASVIARAYPPRVVSEEMAGAAAPRLRRGRFAAGAGALEPSATSILESYRNGRELLAAARDGRGGVYRLRPAGVDEQAAAVEAVRAAVASGRSAVVLVPEVEPVPATGAAVLEAFGGEAVLFAGGSKRSRYRTWLEIADGTYPVVVGTRPAVFAPVPNLGLVYVSRESHAGHREERSPYFHVRDVSAARARCADAVLVLSALCPSAEAAAMRAADVAPTKRWWPPVEVVRPGPEGRAPRVVAAIRSATRAFVYAPLPGAGIARVCRSCGEPAACAECGGMLRAEAGAVRCVVCGAAGRCARCGSTRFGVAPGGAERVESWTSRLASVPVRRPAEGEPAAPVGAHEVLVGGVEAVKDLGSAALGLDVVAILDADLAARRPGLSARERALATWMEVAEWASPHGRVIVQTRSPNDPAVQALVTGNPARFHRAELPRRAEAGFPAGAAVFRIVGTDALAAALEALPHRTLLVTSAGTETICLLALYAAHVRELGRAIRELAGRGIVTRVEAEPHL